MWRAKISSHSAIKFWQRAARRMCRKIMIAGRSQMLGVQGVDLFRYQCYSRYEVLQLNMVSFIDLGNRTIKALQDMARNLNTKASSKQPTLRTKRSNTKATGSFKIPTASEASKRQTGAIVMEQDRRSWRDLIHSEVGKHRGESRRISRSRRSAKTNRSVCGPISDSCDPEPLRSRCNDMKHKMQFRPELST